jgi:hypothetical protein
MKRLESSRKKKLLIFNGKFYLFDAFALKGFNGKRIIVERYYFVFLWKAF